MSSEECLWHKRRVAAPPQRKQIFSACSLHHLLSSCCQPRPPQAVPAADTVSCPESLLPGCPSATNPAPASCALPPCACGCVSGCRSGTLACPGSPLTDSPCSPVAWRLPSLHAWQALKPRPRALRNHSFPVHTFAQLRARLLVWEAHVPCRPAHVEPARAVCTGAHLRLRLGLLVQQAHPPGEAAARSHAGVQLQHLPLRLADGVVQQRAARSPAPHRLQGDRGVLSDVSIAVPVDCSIPASALRKLALFHTTGS